MVAVISYNTIIYEVVGNYNHIFTKMFTDSKLQK